MERFRVTTRGAGEASGSPSWFPTQVGSLNDPRAITAGGVRDDLGTIRFAFCDACRTLAAESWDRRRRRRNWAITYVDPKTA